MQFCYYGSTISCPARRKRIEMTNQDQLELPKSRWKNNSSYRIVDLFFSTFSFSRYSFLICTYINELLSIVDPKLFLRIRASSRSVLYLADEFRENGSNTFSNPSFRFFYSIFPSPRSSFVFTSIKLLLFLRLSPLFLWTRTRRADVKFMKKFLVISVYFYKCVREFK